MRPLLFLLSLIFILTLPISSAAPAPILLPTINNSIFQGEPDRFYMYVHRSFEGHDSKPWAAGKYGFVRNKRRTKDGIIYTKFHEGIDIKPIKRSRSGKPLDDVRAIADGVVAYANYKASKSNYGKYIVIEHAWECGSIYSLYAHLSNVNVEKGQKVGIGQTIGKLGYTGAGINRERAHLHFEIDLLLSKHFPEWHKEHFGEQTAHGNFNGINLAGLDAAAFFSARKRNKSLTLPEFIKTIPVYYKVTVPRTGKLDLCTRYPFLLQGSEKPLTPSWEISFSASGFPIAVTPSNRKVEGPRITSIRQCHCKYSYHTKGYVKGTNYRASLSKTGLRFIRLITDDIKTPEKKD